MPGLGCRSALLIFLPSAFIALLSWCLFSHPFIPKGVPVIETVSSVGNDVTAGALCSQLDGDAERMFSFISRSYDFSLPTHSLTWPHFLSSASAEKQRSYLLMIAEGMQPVVIRNSPVSR